MSPQLVAGTATLKLGFPHGAVHLMKEFILLEREAPQQAGAAVSVGGRGAVAVLGGSI